MVIETLFGECSIDGKTGIKATYWNNREFKGDVAATEQIINPIQLTTFGQHEFSPGVQSARIFPENTKQFTDHRNQERLFLNWKPAEVLSLL